MVLVFGKPSNDIGSLQTKLSDRERHETRRVGLEAMPLDQHVEGGHGERQTRLKIGPASMHNLLQMTHERGNRSGIENLGLALQSRHGIPCHYGNIACPTARHLGVDST